MMQPIPYGPFARLADWYHGWRDGRAQLPDPGRAVATTAHREVLIRRAQDAFERERAAMEARRAETMKELAGATARLAQARDELARATRQLEEIPATLSEPELNRRRYREDDRSAVLVRLRRGREHVRHRARAQQSVLAARRVVDGITEEITVLRDVADREVTATRARVRRIHEHTHRRLASYRRRLVRSHPAGAWVNEIMDSVAPEIPGWAVRGVAGNLLPDGDRPTPPPPDAAEPEPRPEPSHHRLIPIRDVTRFGVQEDVEVRLEGGYGIAGVHATLSRRAGGYRLYDHGRGDGTFQDGQPLRWTDLKIGDTFTIGDYRYRLVSDGVLEETWLDRCDLVVAELNAVDDRGRSRLTRMSFTQRARTVLAIIGPSGAGKSSLFSALLGELETPGGSMYFRKLNLRTHGAQLRTMLGFVPQNDDSMQQMLTVRQLLTFSDRLRRPRDRRGGRAGRVAGVCTRLGIGEHLDRPIAKLSGGQRKRVSIALEILTEPCLLMLDEPTSGLDPAMDYEVMGILRSLAAEDRTVVVATHSTLHLALAQEVLVVGAEGRPVHFGQPGTVTKDLGAGSYAELMKQLTDDSRAVASAYQAGPQARTARRVAGDLGRSADAAVTRPTRARGSGAAFVRQLPVLLHRQFALMLARAPMRNVPELGKRLRGIAVVCMPVLISIAGAVLAGLVVGDNGWGSDTTGAAAASARTAVSLLITLCMLGGQALTYSDIVAEYASIRREHRTGAVTSAVVLAKWLIFAMVAVLQALLVTITFVLVRSGPVRSVVLGPATELFVDLAMMSVAAMSTGLLISVLARRLEQAVALATAAAIAQVALSGGMSDLIGKPWYVQAVSWLLPARWGFAASASSVDLVGLTPGATLDPLWQHESTPWALDLIMLGGLTVLCTAGTIILLNRRLSGWHS